MGMDKWIKNFLTNKFDIINKDRYMKFGNKPPTFRYKKICEQILAQKHAISTLFFFTL
jgi:hypothetical protein